MSEEKITLLSDASRAEIDRWVAKYPTEKKQSAVMAALRIAQEQNGGWLSNELIEAVAHYLEMAPIAAYEVASFYSMYELSPVGRHKINICTNISCMLRGSDEVVSHLEQRLGIKLGETTEDGRFTLKEVECLGACVNAPMFSIDKTYYENLTPETIDKILENLE
ncbi:MAG: NADH-quinone oxidoreductase subunit NuoE [Gammaproteobacteria bacterium]|nr:NADH-quinone oxidoreductase subunit NuoE [Gammaproteobacteria bacterium]MCW8839553.1 NADH-quinone oxidoreductase subunit NuoE [Gammaproteobacteria bacterium]MCW8927345.1 NADH-quinone oxidoreductase subunit NuoE [Gammaproteobacteria bacterium]MCW8957814.1 NADH-quinone oxidoreductase subunit NuoE [Gammaproteobacteria bacterium]MCW8973508.1 NADH-quinone oxidoreductase subunit NuoE [Gammaproteobacteria bacterium]